MKRYIRSYRTRKNIRDTSALRTQFIRQLTKEAEALFQQMSEKFAQDLQAQATQIFQNITTTDRGGAPVNFNTDPGTVGGLGQLLSTGVRYLVSRPRTSTNTSETGRSVDVEAQFRVSRAQAMAEAQAAISKGDKNA